MKPKNRYIKRAHFSERVFRRVLRCFAEDVCSLDCACTGCLMSSSRMTCRAIAAAMARRIWPSSAASRSTSFGRTNRQAASKPKENQRAGVQTSCSKSCNLRGVNLESVPCGLALHRIRDVGRDACALKIGRCRQAVFFRMQPDAIQKDEIYNPFVNPLAFMKWFARSM